MDSIKEEWRPISASVDYVVSNLGRVRNNGRTVHTSNGQVRKYSEKICGHTQNQHGHLKVNVFCDDGVKRCLYVHHLVAEAFIGPRPDGMKVLHGPLGTKVNTPENLSYGTLKQNSADMIRDGTKQVAESHSAAVLDWVKVREIRSRLSRGERVKDLAEAFGVSRQNITAIKVGRSWVE